VHDCSERAGRQAVTSWTYLLTEVDRLISMVIRKVVLVPEFFQLEGRA
jgi:hypothetical protein